MTSTEKIVVFGGGGLFAFWLFTRNNTVYASTHPAVQPQAPSAFDKILDALKNVAPAIGSAFGGGSGSGAAGSGSTGGSLQGGSNGGPQGGPLSSLDAFWRNLTSDNGLNFDGSIASGPLSYEDGTTVDLNLVDPTTGQQAFQVPDQPNGGDASGLLAWAYGSLDEWSTTPDGSYSESGAGDWSYTDPESGVTYQGDAAGNTWDDGGW